MIQMIELDKRKNIANNETEMTKMVEETNLTIEFKKVWTYTMIAPQNNAYSHVFNC